MTNNNESNHHEDRTRLNKKTTPKQNEILNVINQFIGNFVTQKKEVTRENWASKVKSVFVKPVEKEDNKLAGRIRELDKSAKDVLKVLSIVREDLKNEVDGELYTYVESVMTPMIRDVERVKNIVKNEVTSKEQASAFNKYNQWIDKAKLFVHVCSTAKNTDEISVAVIKHTLDDFTAVIERDLQLVEDYQEHLMSELKISENDLDILQNELKEELRSHIAALKSLRYYPNNLTLESLNKWKDGADQARDYHFNTILEIIDNKVEDLNPSHTEEHHSFIENLEQIAYLETEIPMLIKKFNHDKDPLEQKVTFQQLLALEEEVEELYHDIRVPATIVDRLDHLRELLAKDFPQH